MDVSKRSKPLLAFTAVIAAAALTIAGCGSSSNDAAGAPQTSSGAGGSTTPAGTDGSSGDLFAFTGHEPPTDAPKPTPGKNVWIVSCGQAASGCANGTAGIKEAVEAIGWKPTVIDGNFNVADGYGNAIRQALAAGADGILMHGVDCALVTGPLREAKAKKIPVVTSASFDCDDPKNQSPSEPLFTATLQMNSQYPDYGDWLYARGEQLGDYIISKTNGKAKIINEHFIGQLLGEYAQAGLLASLKKCPDCKIVGDVTVSNADLSAGADKQKLAAAAVKAPDANVITYSFSSMVQSSQLQSVVSSMGHDVLVVGGEGQVNNLDIIRSGGKVPAAESAYPIAWFGYGVVDELNRIFAGQQTVPEGAGWAIVDKDHNAGEKGQEYQAPIDYKAAYKKTWGTAS